MIEKCYVFSGEEGFHARPVTELVKIAKQYKSSFLIKYDGEEFDGKSPLSIMSACIEDGVRFSLIINGEDEEAASQAVLAVMIDQNGYFIDTCQLKDASVETCKNDETKEPDKELVTEIDKRYYEGIGVSPGIAIGNAYVYKGNTLSAVRTKIEDEKNEIDTLTAAMKAVEEDLYRINNNISDTNNAEIILVHIGVLNDDSFKNRLVDKIKELKCNAAYALKVVLTEYEQEFSRLKSERMQQRIADIKDICLRISAKITGEEQTLIITRPNTIIVAEDLLPSDTVQLDRSLVTGFITETGGNNSHSAIVARSMGIPAIVGVGKDIYKIKTGDSTILDGSMGSFWVNPDEKTLEEYRELLRVQNDTKQKTKGFINIPTITLDHTRIELAANIFSQDEMRNAVDNGAEGVGLFRTEFLYMNREHPPTLEEQYNIYKNVLESAGGIPVTFRTLDAGGDKPIVCLNMQQEANPFLGFRAIRYCLENQNVLRTQIKALLKASVFGNMRIMFPMITLYEELDSVLKILEEEKRALIAEGNEIDAFQTGVMVETPSAAIICDKLAELVNFFSIGSNDLIQYTMAADRSNSKLEAYCNPYHPSVLRLIDMVSKAARKNNIWVGVCGESAAEKSLIPLYLGMGITELSIAPSLIPETRKMINSLNTEEWSKKVDEILRLNTAEGIKKELKLI